MITGQQSTLITKRHYLTQYTADTECEQMTDFHTTTQILTQSYGTEKGRAAGLRFLFTLKHLLCTHSANGVGGGWRLVWFASHLHFWLSAGLLHCVFVLVKPFQIPAHYSQSGNLNNCRTCYESAWIGFLLPGFISCPVHCKSWYL